MGLDIFADGKEITSFFYGQKLQLPRDFSLFDSTIIPDYIVIIYIGW